MEIERRNKKEYDAAVAHRQAILGTPVRQQAQFPSVQDGLMQQGFGWSSQQNANMGVCVQNQASYFNAASLGLATNSASVAQSVDEQRGSS